MPDGAFYQENPRVEGGAVEVITVGNPAAGVGWTVTIPDGYTYELLAVAALFTTDANAASRTNFALLVTDGSNIELGRTFAVTTCAASKPFQIDAHVGYQAGGAGINDAWTILAVPVGDHARLLPGWKILMPAMTAIQVGDQFSNIRLTVIRRPYPN